MSVRSGARIVCAYGIRVLYVVASALVAVAAIPTLAALGDSGHPKAQLLAFAALGVQLVLLGLAWRMVVTAAIGPASPSWRTFTLGWLVRYVPGPCTLPASKAVELQRAGNPARSIAAAVGTEQVLQALACAVLPLVLAPAYIGGIAGWAMLGAGILVAGATILFPSSRAGARLIPSKWRVPLVPRRSLALSFAALAGAGLCSAFAFHVVVSMVSGDAAPSPATDLFIFTAAGLAGFVAPLVPAGAGAREGSIVVLLSPVTGTTEALEAAVLIRGLSVIVDAGLGSAFIAWTLSRRHVDLPRRYAPFRLSVAKKRA